LLTGPERYGVRLLGDGPDLLLEEQREALEEALLPYLSPERDSAFAVVGQFASRPNFALFVVVSATGDDSAASLLDMDTKVQMSRYHGQ